MTRSRSTIGRFLAALMVCAACGAAHATWHPVIEGEYFPDFDDPTAPAWFSVFPAGVYDPVDFFIGYLSAADSSDTIVFRVGTDDASDYHTDGWRVGFVTNPALAHQVVHLTLTSEASSGPPLLSLDLVAQASGGVSYSNSSLVLDNKQHYSMTFSLGSGGLPIGTTVQYSAGFTVPELPPVPEPAAWVLLSAGLAALAASTLGRRPQG